MRYIIRKILSFILPLAIIVTCYQGITNGFVAEHYYTIGICAVLMASMYFAKLVRKIIFFPFNLLRKVLFRF